MLENANCYNVMQRLVGAERARRIFVERYLAPRGGDRILDIGCGTGEIVAHLRRDVDYTGFDANPRYIRVARRRFGDRATFFCARVETASALDLSPFDVVMEFGLLHHLDDDEAVKVFGIVKAYRKTDARFVSMNPCFVRNQAWLARYLMARDRGGYVRTEEEYRRLAGPWFSSVKVDVRHDLLRIPYTHIVMECR